MLSLRPPHGPLRRPCNPFLSLLLHSHPPQTREYLEKNYEEQSGGAVVKLALRALLETLEASSKTVELAVLDASGLRMVDEAQVDALVKEIEDEKAAQEAQKKAGQAAAAGGAGAAQ